MMPKGCTAILRCVGSWATGRSPGSAASAGQMGRFETKWLTQRENLAALSELAGQ
jgi:hypothetical protein